MKSVMKLLLAVNVLGCLLGGRAHVLAQRSTPRSAVVSAAQVGGTWRGKSGEFRVWALDQRRLRVEFSGIYEYQTPAGPIANLGDARGVARLTGTTAIFEPKGAGGTSGASGRCTITMTFKPGRLTVAEVGECGFGRHVTAAGVYRKASGRKPKFGRPPYPR